MYEKFYANKMLVLLPTHDILYKEIIPKITKFVESDGKQEDAKLFNYFQSHHELLGPLLHLFGFDNVNGTNPADSVIFELYRNKKVDNNKQPDDQW